MAPGFARPLRIAAAGVKIMGKKSTKVSEWYHSGGRWHERSFCDEPSARDQRIF